MTKTLYHYVHCPFCIRVRMTAGFLGDSYTSIVLPYDDEETPIKLIGKKMLPIMDFSGVIMPESLDIMAALDKENRLKLVEHQTSSKYKQLEARLGEISNLVHSLAMPYWAYNPEFNESSRRYFQKKKEIKRGPFSQLVQNRKSFEEPLLQILNQIDVKPYYESSTFSVLDILLSAQLWGLYLVPEFRFPEKIHCYLQKVKEECFFNYYQDFWK